MTMIPTYTVWTKPGRKPEPMETFTDPGKAVECASALLSNQLWVKIELGLQNEKT